MPKYTYPMKAEDIIETNNLATAQSLSNDGYLILNVRTNHFIEDDSKFQTEFIYCLAKPEDAEQSD